MIRRAKAVIGAGYGDEGKGLFTDYHATKGADVVVRYNGGAQAGHTVVTPSGDRHVFHHVGSAAFLGVPTHLSQFFILNPIFLGGEIGQLRSMGLSPTVSADPRALVTTPYDMMINQIVEIARGKGRHGSCGLGIGETAERNLRPSFSLTLADLSIGERPLRDKLVAIRDQWVESRLYTLAVDRYPDEFAIALRDDGIIERFIADCRAFMEVVDVLDDSLLTGDILFEGAQGLLLDQDYGAFPYVTRSNTGLRNVAAFAKEAGIDAIDVTYASRCYTTRHGAGPLAHETTATPWLKMVDPTNAPNDWQGSIRSAPLDLDILKAAVLHDLTYAEGVVNIVPAISLSCLDQVSEGYGMMADGVFATMSRDHAAAFVKDMTGIDVGQVSFGPTRLTIEEVAAN